MLQTKSHALTWDRELTAQQIVDNKLYLCLSHNKGNIEKMKQLISNYGLMYSFLEVNIKIPKIRLQSVPTKLAMAISARRLCPQQFRQLVLKFQLSHMKQQLFKN